MRSPLEESSFRQIVFEQQQEKIRFQNLPLVLRDQVGEIESVIEKEWIKVIMGIRRCGKSMLAHQALKNKEYGYLNFDDERLIGLEAKDLNKMLQFLLEISPGVKILFFDEIQNVDGWELFVNRLQRQGYNLIVTGSNSKLLSKELSTHLTGRYIPIELNPFSFREFLRAKVPTFEPHSVCGTEDLATIYRYLEEYLQTGGFPDMVLGEYYPLYLRELYDKIVSRDITDRYHVKYTKTLKEMAIYSHANLGGKISFHKMKNIFDVSSVHTVKNYFQYLMDAYLVFLMPLFSYKYKEQTRQPRKIYTIDNGLSRAISPKFSEDRGAALENLVFQELKRRKIECAYFMASDCEVDFVTFENRKVTALIQVALSLRDPKTRKRETKALEKAGESLRCKNLKIITWEEEGREENIEIIPLWKWILT